MQLRVALLLVKCEIKSQPLDFTTAMDGSKFFTCIRSQYGGPRSTRLTCSFARFDPAPLELPHRLCT